jgi:hypothetical protein
MKKFEPTEDSIREELIRATDDAFTEPDLYLRALYLQQLPKIKWMRVALYQTGHLSWKWKNEEKENEIHNP